MFLGLKKVAGEIFQESLDFCEQFPTLVAATFLVAGVLGCLLFILYVSVFIVLILVNSMSIELAGRVVVHMFSIMAIVAISLGIGITVIKRKLSRDPGYWKFKKGTPSH